jgi:hypothetical protein
MRDYLYKFYNSWPLKYLSDIKFSLFLHPAQWHWGFDKRTKRLDLGPLELFLGYSRKVWAYDDVYGKHRRYTEEDTKKFVEALLAILKNPGVDDEQLH